jgi:histidine kinase
MSIQKKKLLIISGHIVSWLIFLSLPTVFNPRRHDFSIFGFIDDLLNLFRWTNGLLLVIVFYFNYYIAIPRFYIRQKYVLLSLCFIGSFGIFFLLNYLIYLSMPPDLKYLHSGGIRVLGPSFNFFMFIIVYVFSFAICAYEQWQTTKGQMLNTELSFLKAQINPHFLFNTLNSIYALTLVRSENAPDAVVKLSGMMRYSVSEANLSQVTLSKEIGYISNYIELQKLRITDKIVITFEVTGEMEDKHIAPFLLIPFVENAFKYGVNAEENSDIWIKIEINDFDLNMQIENNKVFVRKDKDYGASLGIKNTKQRLQLLYPGMHVLKIRDGKYDFTVSLYIKFK